MYFDRKYKPELCVNPDATREHMAYVELDVAGERMMATDGHMAVIVPCVPGDHDVSGPISADALKAARKPRLPTCPEIVANGALAIPATGVTYLRPRREAPFPPLDKVMADEIKATHHRVALDVKKLWALAQAMGSDIVELQFSKHHLDPIRVVANHATGVLMPCRR